MPVLRQSLKSSRALAVMALCYGVFVVIVVPAAAAQTSPPVGSLEVSGRVKIGGKQEKLSRKRFYLIHGGLAENKALIERLGAAHVESSDCVYTRVGASPEFICWLKAESCQSPYCRDISEEDIRQVPEFHKAFQKGMVQFRKRDAIAIDWLTTNLPPVLSSGYYRMRRSLTDTLLGDIKPVQSTMTDSVTVKALFIDIPLKVNPAPEKFLITNILPIEFGDKSYLWACEVEIGAAKPVSLRLIVPEAGKPVKNCEVWVNELPKCGSGSCSNK